MPYRGMAIIWGLFIVVISLLPSSSIQKWIWQDIFSLDKAAHFIIYALFIWLVLKSHDVFVRQLVWTMVGMTGFGVLLEVLQNQMYLGRHFEFLDIIANISGLIAGALWFRLTQ